MTELPPETESAVAAWASLVLALAALALLTVGEAVASPAVRTVARFVALCLSLAAVVAVLPSVARVGFAVGAAWVVLAALLYSLSLMPAAATRRP